MIEGFTKWIAAAFSGKPETHPELVVVQHISPTGTVDKTSSIIQHIVAESDTPEKLAEAIVERCTGDATSQGCKSRYKVVLSRTGKPALRWTLAVEALDGGDESEERMPGAGVATPTNASLLDQLKAQMQFNQDMTKILTNSVNGVVGQYQQLLSIFSEDLKQQRTIIQQLSRRNDSDKEVKQGQDAFSLEMQMEREDRERKAKRDDKLFDQLSMLGPLIMGRITGGEAGAQTAMQLAGGTSPAMEQVKGFVGSLNDDQLAVFSQHLEPLQAQTFSEILRNMQPGGSNSNGKAA